MTYRPKTPSTVTIDLGKSNLEQGQISERKKSNRSSRAKTPTSVRPGVMYDTSTQALTPKSRHRRAVSHAAQAHHKMMLSKAANRLCDRAHRKFANLRTLYNTMDSDGDGIIDKSEFKAGLKGAGFTLADIDSSLMFDMVDEDGNGLMAYQAFCKIFNPNDVRFSGERLNVHRHVRNYDTAFKISTERHHLPKISPQKAEYLRDRLQQKIVNKEKDAKLTPTLLHAFKTFDPRQNQVISYAEFRRAMGKEPPGLNLGLTETELTELISLVDGDRDGVITLKEFITSLSRTESMGDFVKTMRNMEMDGLQYRLNSTLPPELEHSRQRFLQERAGDTKKEAPSAVDVARKVVKVLRKRCKAAGRVRKIFRNYDEDKSGSVSEKELSEVMQRLGISLDSTENKALFSFFDRNQDGSIYYDEFTDAVFQGDDDWKSGPIQKRTLKNRRLNATLKFSPNVSTGNVEKERKSFGQFVETMHDTIAGRVDRGGTPTLKRKVSVPDINIRSTSMRRSSFKQGSNNQYNAVYKRGLGTKISTSIENSDKIIKSLADNRRRRHSRKTMFNRNRAQTPSIIEPLQESSSYISEKLRMRTSSSVPNGLVNELAGKCSLGKQRAFRRSKKGHAQLRRYNINRLNERDMADIAEEDRLKSISLAKWKYNEFANRQEMRAPGRKPGKTFAWNEAGVVLSKEGVRESKPTVIFGH